MWKTRPSPAGRSAQSFDQLVRQVILSDELKENFVANYYFTAPNGKRIRSSTLLIRDGDGRLTGALCLNLDTTRLTQQIAYLQSLLPQPREPEPEPPEPQTGAEHVAVMIENLMDRIIGDEPPLTREARLEKIRFMDSKGIFLMKGSIEKAAEKLGVNKVTIYSYLTKSGGNVDESHHIRIEAAQRRALRPWHDLGPNALYLRPAPGPP